MAKSKKKKIIDDPLLFLKEVMAEKKISQKDILFLSENNYPLFSFRWLSDFSICQCNDAKFFFEFLMRLKKISELGWNEIRTSARHSFGMESIPKTSIKTKKIPEIITPDVSELHVFRASGDNRAMVGLQIGRIFHVLFIEAHFNDVYDH